MTYVKRCNKCGIDIKDLSNDNELTFTQKRNSRFGYDKCMHLCNDCLKKFDKFMLEKGEEDGKHWRL